MSDDDEAIGLMSPPAKIMTRAKSSIEKLMTTLDVIDDDLILSANEIGEDERPMGKNLLLEKRERVRRLEGALTRAREQKRICDAALQTKVDLIESAKPKLPPGTIDSFIITPGVRVPNWKTRVSYSQTGVMVEVPGDTFATNFERQRAKEAHSDFCQADRELQDARRDLRKFETELKELRDRMACLNDL